jgi:hypothetical protein
VVPATGGGVQPVAIAAALLGCVNRVDPGLVFSAMHVPVVTNMETISVPMTFVLVNALHCAGEGGCESVVVREMDN